MRSFPSRWPVERAGRANTSSVGDEVPVPTQQGCRLDEEAGETVAGEQSCEPRQHGPIRRSQRRSMDLAAEHRHFVSEHDDLDGEVSVAAADESDQMEDARRLRPPASKSRSGDPEEVFGTDTSSFQARRSRRSVPLSCS